MSEQQSDTRAMTRAQYIAFLVEQAPEITSDQWDATVADLRALRPLRRRGDRESPAPPQDGPTAA